MTKGAATGRPTPWYRRRGLMVGAAVVVLLVVTVLTDLPVTTSRAQDIASERSVMSELNADVGPCALAVHQALGIWALQASNTLTAIARSDTPGLLSDDQSACSFADESIFDLSNIEVPGSPAGKDLGDLVATTTLWTTSDALGAIEDVQTLMTDPADARALDRLSTQEHRLASDRETAHAEEGAADRTLDTRLPPADLPALPQPSRG
ncbi:MAG: hypothetical protein ACLQMT_05700 [Candidatus Acidiferrales bacterium]